jgi:starch synthase
MRAFSDRIVGIVNGIDMKMYDPHLDGALSTRYDYDSFREAKKSNKHSLFKELGWDFAQVEERFLVGFVGRLTHQKNISLMVDSARIILKNKGNLENLYFVFLGVGDAAQEKLLMDLAAEFPHNVAFVNRFDEALAHRIFAGGDLFLIPSEFEPCGLTQMLAMRYGALPLATRVGGLVDTIDDSRNKQIGFFIREVDPAFMSVQILDLFTFWKNAYDEWAEIIKRAMLTDFSWKESAKRYLDIYISGMR